jgi:DNA-binding transcriptional ArsR family regulator
MRISIFHEAKTRQEREEGAEEAPLSNAGQERVQTSPQDIDAGLEEGLIDIARQLGVSIDTVEMWLRVYRKRGIEDPRLESRRGGPSG